MPDSKKGMLESRLSKRLRILALTSYSEYLDFVFSPAGRETELINMIDAVTTNKTDFSREAEHFDYLIERIIPDLGCGKGSRPAAFWSVGCSTGEEIYTLAMVLEEYKRKAHAFIYSIFASDLSTKAPASAEHAIYAADRADPIPMSFKKAYLLRSKDSSVALVRIKPELRGRIRFGRII
jgi:chemotaxis protein methyltransferase CheR